MKILKLQIKNSSKSSNKKTEKEKKKTKERNEIKMKEKLNMFDKNSTKGITLIALVITIIVLLILAAVSIATLTGPNGLLTRANDAKTETGKAGAKEKVQMEVAASYDNSGNLSKDMLNKNLENIEGITGTPIQSFPATVVVDGYEVTIDEDGNVTVEGEPTNPPTPPAGDTAKPGEIVTGGNKEYTDETGTAVIPEGFAVVTNPDEIENGLVISDKPNDDMENTAEGNQFVWVPVSKENFETEFVRQDFGNQNISDTNFINTQPESGKYYETTPTSTDLTGTTQATIEEVTKMYNSVKTNGGFYIGRYEAGKEGTDTLVIKKNATVYNDIKWGNSMTDEKGGAVEKSRGMYPGKSILCYGVQWDAVMRWISKDTSLVQYLKDSTGKGNYNDEDSSNNPAKTGSNPAYQMKNIYDMAGNVWEWIMEAYNPYGRGRRGGVYGDPGSDYPVTYRSYNYDPSTSNNDIGFRVALYV